MEIAVLAKVVPPGDALRADPARRAVVRDAVPMVLNPFDQRALRGALELRRSGERLTVVSLGPPNAEGPLREVRALGADRVVLLTDPRLAGSDTLATARVLVRALTRIGHGLVLAGRTSTDSDTGQVGAEVAALLGVPVVSAARRIVRDADGDGMEVVGETDSGTATYRVDPPAVVTVGEKLGKPLRPTPEQLAAVADAGVERWNLEDLGLAPATVGGSGSPTEVVALTAPAPVRTGLRFDLGSTTERVELAWQAIERRWKEQPPPSARSPAPVLGPLADVREAWVLATGASGEKEPTAPAILGYLRTELAPLWPSVVWVGNAPSSDVARELANAGALRGYWLPVEGTEPSSAEVAHAVSAFLDARPRTAAGLFASTTFGREVAGGVAARAELGLTGDVVAATCDASGEVLWSKPSFGGELLATIRSRTRPSLATVRPGAFGGDAPVDAGADLTWTRLDVPDLPSSVRLLGRTDESDPEFGDLSTAGTVLCVGMGVGGPEAIRSLVPLLGRMGAALAATRKVVDAGWVPRHRQVGLTGRHLAPRLVLLAGVGGSMNHLVGWRRAGTLVAINTDPGAAVFGQCDVGVVGPWREVLDALADRLSPSAYGTPG